MIKIIVDAITAALLSLEIRVEKNGTLSRITFHKHVR